MPGACICTENGRAPLPQPSATCQMRAGEAKCHHWAAQGPLFASADLRVLSFGWFVNIENTGRGTAVYKAETDFLISTLKPCPEMGMGIRNDQVSRLPGENEKNDFLFLTDNHPQTFVKTNLIFLCLFLLVKHPLAAFLKMQWVFLQSP